VTFPLGYTDGVQTYLPVTSMFPEGGYEVDGYWEWGYPSRMAPNGEHMLEAKLVELRDSGVMANAGV